MKCPNCGQFYAADPSRLKYGRQTTCSRQCSYVIRGKKNIVTIFLVCDICGNNFTRKPFQIRAKTVTVCSWNCYVQLRKQRSISKPKPSMSKLPRKQRFIVPRPTRIPPCEYNCEQCGKHVSISASLIGARKFRFCSQECANT